LIFYQNIYLFFTFLKNLFNHKIIINIVHNYNKYRLFIIYLNFSYEIILLQYNLHLIYINLDINTKFILYLTIFTNF